MKKREVKTIFEDDTIRKNKILRYIFLSVGSLLVACIFLFIFINKNQVQYAKYDESSNIDYSVFLKDNEFFNDNYLTRDKQYISTLIDYINAKFNYKLTLEDNNVDYKYSYKIDAVVKVVDKDTKKVVYSHVDNLIPIKDLESDEKVLTINESIKIDYNKYNDMMKKFVSVYELSNIESTLDVNASINVVGSCEELNENSSNESVMTLSIPLTQKTMGIDIRNNLINSEDNLMVCAKPSPLNYIFLIVAFIFVVLALTTFVNMIIYSNSTRTAQNVYDKELKRILNNYGPYIQKVDGAFNLKGYQALKIDSFTDMLEIRDTIQQPILMVENARQNGVFFIIPSNTKILYIYGIKVSDIAKELKKQQEERELEF
jgi:hypothetical protein